VSAPPEVPQATTPTPPLPVRLREIALVMLRLGAISFGGPAAQLALMHEELVRRRKWVSEQEYLDLLGASGLIPGPTSTETAIHLGMSRGGPLGLWVAGLCFILPAILITGAFAWAYVELGTLPAAEGLLRGIKPAVVAIILAAVIQLARTAGKTTGLRLLGVAALAVYLLGGNELAVLIGCGLLTVAARRLPPKVNTACAAWFLVGAPALDTAAAGRAGVLDVFLYFLKVGATLFGSGYVLLAFLRQGIVQELGWLTEQQLVDAVAVGQFTPGPLFSTATFAGYVVGERLGFGGWAGAIAGSLGIFLPSFVLVRLTHPLVQRLRQAEWTAAFLDGINAGSVALMAGVTYQLAASALALRPEAWTIFLAAAVAVFYAKVNSAWVVLAAGLIGVLFLR
jgi:chromate transporter